MAFFRHFLFRERARVRQLKRTELARRVESAQCLRSPHSLTKLAGAPIDSYSLEVRGGDIPEWDWGLMDKERFRSAAPVDRLLCSLEMVDRAAPLERESGDARGETIER